MEMSSVREIIQALYTEIEGRNSLMGYDSIPQSDEFIPKVSKKLNLNSETVPELLNILANSNMIFSFNTVSEQVEDRVAPVEGYIVSKGNVILKLKKFFEAELVEQFAIEFNRKFSEQRAVREVKAYLDDYNNTELGRVANIAISLGYFEKNLEWNISKYNSKFQEQELAVQLSIANPPEFYLLEKFDNKSGNVITPAKKTENGNHSRRAMDSPHIDEFRDYLKTNTIERTLNVYGVEFYTRVCFRDYQFSLIRKVIDLGLVKNRSDFMTIKRLLLKERANADQDLKIQEFAQEINLLEKVINEKLKSLS